MRGHCAPPFASKCTILDFFRFKNKNFGYRRYSVIYVVFYCVFLKINVIFTISYYDLINFALFTIKVSWKIIFSQTPFFIRDHTFMPTTRKKGCGGGDLKSVTCLWILLFLHNIYVVLFCRWRGFFTKLIFCGGHTCMTLYSAWLWLFFFLPYFSPIMEFEVHGGSNRKNIDRSCITNEQCE